MRTDYLKKQLSITFIFLFLFFIPVLNADDLYFEKRDFSNLTIPSVSCITQDNRGYIWVGTPGGLLRYDSRNPLLINRKSHPELPSDHILSLDFSKETGELWIGTSGGMARYNLNLNKIERVSFLRKNKQIISSEVVSIAVAGPENVFAVSGQHLFHLKNEYLMEDVSVEQASGDSVNDIHKLISGRNGALWAVAADGLKKWDADRENFKHVLTISSANCLASIGSDIWVGTNNGSVGLLRYSPETQSVKGFSVFGEITSITSDSEGMIWAGSENNGLFIINPETSTVRQCDLDTEHPYKLPSQRIESLYHGNSGHLWIGTADSGLLSVDIRKSNHLEYIRRAGSNGLPSGSVLAILEDSLGYIWIGSSIGGIARINSYSGDIQQYTHNSDDYFSIASDHISGIVEDGTGSLWVGTDKGPVLYLPEVDGFEPAGFMMSGWPDFQGRKVLALTRDHEGCIWISFKNGDLYKLNSQKREYSVYKYPSSMVPVVLFIDPKGVLWAGSEKNLRLFNTEGQLIKTWSASGTDNEGIQLGGITEIFSDSRGRIWLGGPSGLSVYQGFNEGFKSLFLPDGQNLNVSGITEDQVGNIWVSDGRHIQIFNSDTEYISTMNTQSGFTPSGLITSLYKASNGTIYVGTNSEIWNYTSVIPALQITHPVVNLTELRVMNEVIASGYSLYGLESKHLNSDEKVFRISFDAVDYRYQGEITYQYKLKGFNDEWITNGKNESVTFANLPPAEYLFSVRAVNEFGDFSQNEASIKIIVNKSYWKKTPAIIMYAFIVAAIFFAFLKMWEGHLMKVKINELEEARLKIIEANKKLSFLTMNDSLTGLLNRRGFDSGIAHALGTAHRNSLMITLYMMDVDNFKLYNDNYGHVQGDEVLRGVGKALRQVFGRSTDIITRYGGEEFAVVFIGENPNASVTLANDLISAIEELGIIHEYSPVSKLLTLSVGSATIRAEDVNTVESLIQHADEALYAAKEGGRNRICYTGIIPELPDRMKSGLKPLILSLRKN